MPRYEDIRAEVQGMVDRLYELHDATDRRRGEASELNKLQNAQRAIAIWWYIYARLMQWAQNHIIGYEMARLNPLCQDVLLTESGGELHDDSHALERLGSVYIVNRPIEDETLEKLSGTLKNKGVELDDTTLRRVIVRLLLSTSTESSVWRFPLSHALTALNHGEVTEFVTPTKRKRRGQSYKLDHARSNAISHVYYLLGKGLKKHAALTKVGDAIGQSVETLRDWEKKLQYDDWFRFLWEAAHIAGYIEDDPDAREEEVELNFYDGIHSNVEIARYFLQRELRGDCSLPKIKEDLRKYHT